LNFYYGSIRVYGLWRRPAMPNGLADRSESFRA
jgi:hypothetical protein